MKISWTSKALHILNNEQGQMAVFVALIFQVLFVFFAMVINIGMIVHDKINLQNSADIAAYYGAERQAELLNEIAHINYQIHQDNKLLAWRYRVLGTLGRDNHPAQTGPMQNPQPLTDTLYADSVEPTVCVDHSGIKEVFDEAPTDPVGTNTCRGLNQAFPPLPAFTVVPLAFQLVPDISGIIDAARQRVSNLCNLGGSYNWLFTGEIIQAYRMSLAARKGMIKVLAGNLSQSSSDFQDQNMQSVAAGAKTTLMKNLTVTNRDNVDFQFINGLAIGPCAALEGAGIPHWLSEITTRPILLYNDSYSPTSGDCLSNNISPHTKLPTSGAYQTFDPSGSLASLLSQEYPETDLHRSSRGFEKNPWCMAYVGVKATSHPIKPFAPFGSPITLVARSFAQPFGGRIGPWDRETWPASSPRSVGDLDSSIDRVGVIRSAPGGSDAVNAQDPANRDLFLPNYSRYPGDTLGLKSLVAVGNTRAKLAPIFNRQLRQQISLKWFAQFGEMGQYGDTLSFDPTGVGSYLRSVEAAVIAPDLFDITYYSVETQYFANYFNLDIAPLATGQSRFPSGAVISDLGSRLGSPKTQTFSVIDQITAANSGNLDLAATFYEVTGAPQVLTGWNQGRTLDYTTFPVDSFGQCPPGEIPDLNTDQPSIPGNCVAGGRVGYSIRIISKDFLRSSSLQLGGTGQTGGLLNPPGDF